MARIRELDINGSVGAITFQAAVGETVSAQFSITYNQPLPTDYCDLTVIGIEGGYIQGAFSLTPYGDFHLTTSKTINFTVSFSPTQPGGYDQYTFTVNFDYSLSGVPSTSGFQPLVVAYGIATTDSTGGGGGGGTGPIYDETNKQEVWHRQETSYDVLIGTKLYSQTISEIFHRAEESYDRIIAASVFDERFGAETFHRLESSWDTKLLANVPTPDISDPPYNLMSVTATCTSAAAKIVGGYMLIDPDTGTEHQIVAAHDSENNLRFYAYDDSYPQKWVELTEKITATVSDLPNVGAKFVYIADVKDALGNRVELPPDYLRGFIGIANGKAFIVRSSSNNWFGTYLYTVGTTLTWPGGSAHLGIGLDLKIGDLVTFYRNLLDYNSNHPNVSTINFVGLETYKSVRAFYGDSLYINDAQYPLRIEKQSERKLFPLTKWDDLAGNFVAGDAELVLPEGWYADYGGGLSPDFVSLGTRASPVRLSSAVEMTLGNQIRAGDKALQINKGSNIELRVGDLVNTYDLSQTNGRPLETRTVIGFRDFGGKEGFYLAFVDKPFEITWPQYLTGLRLYQSDPNYSKSIIDSLRGDWLDIRAKVSETYEDPDTGSGNMRLYVTLLYDNRQESDPIYQLFAAGTEGEDRFPVVGLTFAINPARMPRNVTGMNIYCAYQWEKDVPHKDWLDSPNEYKLVKSISFYEWDFETARDYLPYKEKCFEISSPTLSKDYILSHAGASISDMLGRAIDTNRSYFKSRYGTKTKQRYGAVVVVDENDRSLRVSAINGAGVAEEDNFPDISADNTGSLQKIALTSTGTLLGLATVGNNVIAFKPTQIELIDLHSGIQRVFAADVVSPKSIVETPYGVVWAGEAGLYLLSESLNEIELINSTWQNYYNGTLLNPSGNPYITPNYRKDIIAGYDPYYHEIVFAIKIDEAEAGQPRTYLFRYSPIYGWTQRAATFGDKIKFFNQDGQNRLLIGCEDGVLAYPNTTIYSTYKDAVRRNEWGQYFGGKPISCKLKFNWGSLYDLIKNHSVFNFLIDHLGKSRSGVGKYQIKFYKNLESTPFDEKTSAIDQRAVRRKIVPTGLIRSLQIEISLPEDSQDDIEQFDISTIELGLVPYKRAGNR